jgi:peroxiredoxin family protein
MGRACGGLCASCQRLYDFQRGNLNFDLEKLKPVESWPQKQERLMAYFERDSQLRDILITGGALTAVGTMVGLKKIDEDHLVIGVMSGSFDETMAAFIIAIGAAASEMEVDMFFTFWATAALRDPKKKVSKGMLDRMFGWMLPKGSKRLPLSKMQMAGIGPKMIRSVMKARNVRSLEELIQDAGELGVRIHVCTMSMDVMGIKGEELIDYPNIDYVGVGSFIGMADRAASVSSCKRVIAMSRQHATKVTATELLGAEHLDDEGCQLLADFFSVFAHPIRMQLLCQLRQGRRTVSELAGLAGITVQNASQSLSISLFSLPVIMQWLL